MPRPPLKRNWTEIYILLGTELSPYISVEELAVLARETKARVKQQIEEMPYLSQEDGRWVIDWDHTPVRHSWYPTYFWKSIAGASERSRIRSIIDSTRPESGMSTADQKKYGILLYDLLCYADMNPDITASELTKLLGVRSSTLNRLLAYLPMTQSGEGWVIDKKNVPKWILEDGKTEGLWRFSVQGRTDHINSAVAERRMIELIEKNPDITMGEIRDQMGVGDQILYRIIKKSENISRDPKHAHRFILGESVRRRTAHDSRRESAKSQIRRIVSMDPSIRQKDIAELVGYSVNTVSGLMKEMGYRNVGSRGNRHWENDTQVQQPMRVRAQHID